ncbi:glycerophosphodiester phosphodiesterase [Pontibacillus yanchengensis]|uniref:Glycerophosphodiester phosphodiesterase n=1 Tax=Pontibacillus yanchengensis Y32 TaxID=1385514 RepID=A0A0A2TDG9_9BACI|nr:glycerophosphodiester phosphodiesterase [Pontibacillus yanchengensis]KGP72151.1 glycerophosphodiester phosphodiesterase [Pontibacillus yanchengensis Y32]
MNTSIFAHRGASHFAPENTMPAFELAINVGAEGIETDVQLTKDNIPVLIHDETLHRTTNGSGYVKDHTYNELKTLDAGSWFAPKYQGTSLVTLEEFLTWAQDQSIYINIELKNNIIDYSNIESIVYEYIKAFNLQSRVIISSFNPNSVKRFGKLTNEIETALLLSQRSRNALSYVKQVGASALHAKYSLLTKKLVEDCQDQDLSLRIYTVNRPSRIMRCYKLKCDGIFTDVPHSAIEYQELYRHKHS